MVWCSYRGTRVREGDHSRENKNGRKERGDEQFRVGLRQGYARGRRRCTKMGELGFLPIWTSSEAAGDGFSGWRRSLAQLGSQARGRGTHGLLSLALDGGRGSAGWPGTEHEVERWLLRGGDEEGIWVDPKGESGGGG